MGELFDYVKNRYSRQNKSETRDMMEKTRVKNSVESLCSANLEEAGDIFEFEVSQKYLQYMVSIIEEEPLKSKYEIRQTSPTMFSARLLEVEL